MVNKEKNMRLNDVNTVICCMQKNRLKKAVGGSAALDLDLVTCM